MRIGAIRTQIGLMRGGRLLAESSPQQLLQRFQCSSLEEAFLALSRAQDNVDLTDISTAQTSKEGDSESNILCQNQTEVYIKSIVLENEICTNH